MTTKKDTIKGLKEGLLPDNLYPIHLRTWADQMDREFGYKGSQLCSFLRKMADIAEVASTGKVLIEDESVELPDIYWIKEVRDDNGSVKHQPWLKDSPVMEREYRSYIKNRFKPLKEVLDA